MTALPAPVERVCCCPPYSDGSARPATGNANHLAPCNARHASAFFASVLMAREDFRADVR